MRVNRVHAEAQDDHGTHRKRDAALEGIEQRTRQHPLGRRPRLGHILAHHKHAVSALGHCLDEFLIRRHGGKGLSRLANGACQGVIPNVRLSPHLLGE